MGSPHVSPLPPGTEAEEDALAAYLIFRHYKKLAENGRVQLSPGTYFVEKRVTLNIAGSVTVEPDSEGPALLFPERAKRAFALFIWHAGLDRDRSLQILARCLKEAVSGEPKEPSVSALLSGIKAILGMLPREPRKGAVRTAVSISEEDTEEVTAS